MATKRYDLERLIEDVKLCLTTNLNNKIYALNLEKNDSVLLAQIDPRAYVIQSNNGQTNNYDPFVFIGVVEIAGEGIGPATSQEYKIMICLCFSDFKDLDVYKRFYRYHRALKETIEENWRTTAGLVEMRLTSLAPVDFKLTDTSKLLRAVGVELTAILA